MKTPTPSLRLKLHWLRMLTLGGNYGYAYCNTWYAGWRPNLLRLTWKWWSEGWGRPHGNGQHVYPWREFCWSLPHEAAGYCSPNGHGR